VALRASHSGTPPGFVGRVAVAATAGLEGIAFVVHTGSVVASMERAAHMAERMVTAASAHSQQPMR
jgi:hypothetical protein